MIPSNLYIEQQQNLWQIELSLAFVIYIETGLKRPLKNRQNKGLKTIW